MKTLAPPAPAPAPPPVSSSSSAAAPSSILLRKPRLSPNNCYTIFTLFAFVIFLTILYSEDFSCIFSQVLDNSSSSSSSFSSSFSSTHGKYSILTRKSRGSAAAATRAGGGDHELKPQKKRRAPVNLPFSLASAGGGGGCDVFSGKWVLDEANRPLYEEWECPYIQPQLTCQEHGRPDNDYQRWRWQPHSCSLPSFNASLMLETLRGKRMMFVGDSLNRGQYISMVCLLHRIIPEDAKSMETNGSLTIFRAKEYNASIEFYWAPFLLESNSDDAVAHRISDRVVRRGSINKHGRHWKGVDIMVFNTYLWWMTGLKFKILQGGSFEDQVKDIVEVSTEDAYRMGMKSMLRWVKKNMDPSKTRVFFTSMSPSHQKSIDWGGEPNGNCYNETGMIEDAEYWGSDCRRSILRVIDQVLSKSEVPITFLNITQLSNYRKDAHTSIYKKQWSPLSPQQLANPASYADCVHWCLPGLQDTWNELLFAKLFYP